MEINMKEHLIRDQCVEILCCSSSRHIPEMFYVKTSDIQQATSSLPGKRYVKKKKKKRLNFGLQYHLLQNGFK